MTNTKNSKSVVVHINDRGPTQAGRVIDLTSAAAGKIGIGKKAMAPVKLDVVKEAPAKKYRRFAQGAGVRRGTTASAASARRRRTSPASTRAALSRAASHAAVSRIVSASGRIASPAACAREQSIAMKPALSGSLGGSHSGRPVHGVTPCATSVSSSIHAGAGGDGDACDERIDEIAHRPVLRRTASR